MAYVLNKEPSLYDKEKDRFIQELQHFHETRGTPSRRIPKINGHEIDLYLLYNLVTERGGWLKVNSRNEWEQVLADFDIPKRCVNSSVAIKQIYLRYLDRYEKIHFLGEVGERGADDDEDSRHRRWSARALHSVPLTYNHAQHNVNESLREYNGLSIDLHKPSEYEKLTLSLISPLPNEQDFAINICTLLSNEGKYCLKLDRHPRLLHFLLAHAAVFSNSNIKSLFHELYGKDRGHSMAFIWRDVVADSNILRLADETLFYDKKSGSHSSELQQPQTSETNKSNLKLDPEDNELFCLGRTLGIQDYIGQRVCQIATIVRNLTFLKENVPIMGRDLTFLRFVLLCCNSNWNGLQQMGWDMLGNICTEITIHSPLIEDILFISTRGLISQDRAIILSSLEVLNKLGQSENNEEYLLRYLEQEVYDRLCSFLTLHDIMLLVYTLECLNTISSLGEKACNSILRVRGALDILVSLITVEAQSYGPKACIQMRVVETVTGGASGVVCQPTQSSTVSSTVTATNVTPGAQQLLTSAASATPVLPHLASSHQNLATPVSAVTVAVPTPVPVSSTATLLSSPVSSSVTLSTVATTQKIALAPANTNSTIPAHATQQVAQENEQYALTWLRSTFELHTGGRIEQAELYKQYINYCQKIGRRGVIAPLHFPRCVRTVFGGTIGPKPLNVGDTTQHFYEGIQSRAKPLSPTPSVINTTQVIQSPQVQSTPSPILKAQLSAPPKPTPSNPQSAKVTQRQQQQRLLQQQQSPPQLNSLIKIEESPSKIPMQSVVFQNNKTINCKVNGIRDSDKLENPNGALFISGNDHSINKPPPLTPLSTKNSNNFLSDEAASASNSMASSTGNREGGEEGENSVSSFDGFMMNGVPNNLECEDATSKDSAPKSMMLADLLEKNVDKNEPPVLNGSLRIGEKGLELIQGKDMIKKEIKEEKVSVPLNSSRAINGLEMDSDKLDENSRDSLKRPSDSTEEFPESKKPHLNGDVKIEETPEEGAVSSTAANLYAALAADALEDEPLEELEPPQQQQQQQQQQPLIMASPQPRQILVTGPGQLTQRVVVGGQHYVVTQPQTALVQGQTQTVLVAQTPQQQGTAAKTIIILQPQGVAGNQHQKVIMQRLQSPPPPPLLATTSQPSANPIRSVTPPKPSPTPPLIASQTKTVKTIKTATSVITPTIQTSINQNISSVSSCSASTSSQSISTVAMPSIPAPCATPVTVVTTSTLMSSSSSMATSNSITTSPSSTTPKSTEQGHFLCEWRGCMRNFKSGNEVYMHACEAHCPQGTQEIQCLWERCDAMKRKRFSLMTHLYDKHCNADVMRMMAVRRKQLSVSGRSEIPPPSPAAPHPGYAPNAAFHAIKRHALEFVNPKELQQRAVKPGPIPVPVQSEQDDNEGPVTKSIRLTAALILRNLVIYSTHGRRHLTRYEPHLASVALSNVESSRTIAHVLFDMNNQR